MQVSKSKHTQLTTSWYFFEDKVVDIFPQGLDTVAVKSVHQLQLSLLESTIGPGILGWAAVQVMEHGFEALLGVGALLQLVYMCAHYNDWRSTGFALRTHK